MKLKTMLLPTGEFLLIGENLKWNDQLPETLRTLKEATGAAGFFVADQDVEIEDAVFDENAVRRDEDGMNYVDTTGPDGETWTVLLPFDQAEAWKEAERVSTSLPSYEKVETGETTEVVRTGTTEDFGKVLDEPARELYDHVTGADGITTVTPKYTPKPGDHVRIVTVNGWEDPDVGENVYVGAEGTVVSRYTLSTSDCWLVDIGPGLPHLAASKLELIAPASEGGQ